MNGPLVRLGPDLCTNIARNSETPVSPGKLILTTLGQRRTPSTRSVIWPRHRGSLFDNPMTPNAAPQHFSSRRHLKSYSCMFLTVWSFCGIFSRSAEKSWRPSPPAVQSTESRHDRMPRGNQRPSPEARSTGFMQFFAAAPPLPGIETGCPDFEQDEWRISFPDGADRPGG